MTGELAKALAAFQAEMPTVAKGEQAEVATKSGGKYSYTYANLASLTEAAMPLLAKNGLAFTTLPRGVETGWVLQGVLLHESGEQLEATLPLHGGGPQELGSSLTYMRRYLLGCMTGIVTDDDDDGKAAQTSSRDGWTRTRPTAPTDDPWTTPAEGSGPRPSSDKQQKAVHAVMTKVGYGTREDILTELSSLLGREIHSAADLTAAEASKAIDTYGEKR